MTRRILQFATLAALCFGVFVQQSSAAVTYRIENKVILAGTTSGTFDIFMDVTAPDLGLFVEGVNISAGLGGGTLGGGGAGVGVLLGKPTAPIVNPLFPANGPSGSWSTTSFQQTVAEIPKGIGVPASPTGKSIVTVPFSLAAPAVTGEMIVLQFNNLPSPFNNYTPTGGLDIAVPANNLLGGSISVTAVPEPGSTLALSVLFVAGGVRRYRKNRKTA